MKWPQWEIKFVQLELVKDGKDNSKTYGPYWYGYNFAGAFTKKCYIGKELPRALAHLCNDRKHWQPPEADQEQDLAGQLTLDDMPELTLRDHWLEELELDQDSNREDCRKAVYHFTRRKGIDQNSATACQAWFAAYCLKMSWKLPKSQG